MSSSEELREGNAFSGESSFSEVSISSIDLEDYLEPEPKVEITGTTQSSPWIKDLLKDQSPQHVRKALEYSTSFQYMEGE
ncbi:hypothetical protein PanWU01x14_237340, partial [Parasponia andersonii]